MTDSNWLQHYRTNKAAVWVKCRMCTGEYVYIDDISVGWIALVQRCRKEKIYIKHMTLQFRSHEVELDISDIDGIYLIKSVLGQMGGVSRQYITFGRIIDGKVYKQMWITPDLILDKEYIDPIKDCFEEAIIYDEFRAKEKKANG